MTKIYIASPLGFSESGRFFLYGKIVPLMDDLNLSSIDPWKLTPENLIERVNKIQDADERKDEWNKLNRIIAENNKNGIIESDGILAILDGTDVDSGTASEIGFGYAMNKKICGYRSDFRRAGDNEGAIVNLQVEYFILNSGGRIVSDLLELENELRRIFIF
ncbi:MAG: 2-deoxyribonucleoside glycosidase [Spirochaetae bacterium HGW-Spirochaetae-5]|nr:MAG: 2-deoxyribonucleoside glycosidase [Spirochaetae bacterium HGW-Spirochaetae-5]